MAKDSVVKLLSVRQGSLRQQFEEHIQQRVDAEYPLAEHGSDAGAVPERLRAHVSDAHVPVSGKGSTESAFDHKQATGHDRPFAAAEALADLRPSIVVGESNTQGAVAEDVMVASAFNKVTGMTVRMGHKFEEQFVPSYVSRVFPWSLNYSCGGADYPDLFSDWDSRALQPRESQDQSGDKIWRRVNAEATLLPGPYAQMLASRVEMQVSGDWLLVPAARNLHWRYEVLHSAFIVCKQRLAPSADMDANLLALLKATEYIWERMGKNSVTVKGVVRPINGWMSNSWDLHMGQTVCCCIHYTFFRVS